MTVEMLLALVKGAVSAIRTITSNQVALTAAEVADAVLAVVGAVESATEGNVTPDQARTSIASLVGGLKANDAAADAALEKKFPGDKP